MSKQTVLEELTIRINSIVPGEDRTAMIHAVYKIETMKIDLQSRLDYSKNQMADFAKLNNENNDLKTKIREWEDHHMEWNFADSCSDKRIAELVKENNELKKKLENQ